MRFKRPELATEYAERLHPDVRFVLGELDDWSLEHAIPEVVVTSLGRTVAENKAANGTLHSWHLYGCAADIRVSHYTPAQRKSVMQWLSIYCTKPLWELLEHNAGSGVHVHVAKRDFSWRNTFAKRPAHA